MDSNRRVKLAVLIVLLGGSVLSSSPGRADDEHDFPVDRYMKWRPTFGRVITTDDPSSDDPRDHRVINRFGWSTWISRSKLDNRTYDNRPDMPPRRGTYEHELRFKPEGSTGEADPWCEGGGIEAGGTDWDGHVPPGTYHDWTTVDEVPGENGAEFSWGLPGWEVDVGEVYEIRFDCSTSEDEPVTDYNLTGELGHCSQSDLDAECDTLSVYRDEAVKHIPRRLGVAPEDERWRGSFPGSMPSFDGPPSNPFGDWEVQNGTMTQVCDADRAFHGECFAKVVATNPSKRPILTFDYDPPGSQLGTASVYSEFALQCPTGNQFDCPVKAVIIGLSSLGQEVGGPGGNRIEPPPVTVGRSNAQWSFSGVPNNGSWREFESGTQIWRFQLVIGTGRTLHIDYHQQSYEVPL